MLGVRTRGHHSSFTFTPGGGLGILMCSFMYWPSMRPFSRQLPSHAMTILSQLASQAALACGILDFAQGSVHIWASRSHCSWHVSGTLVIFGGVAVGGLAASFLVGAAKAPPAESPRHSARVRMRREFMGLLYGSNHTRDTATAEGSSWGLAVTDSMELPFW